MAHSEFRLTRPPSLDWQIVASTAIVLVSHISTMAAVEIVPTDPPVYRPMHVLRFSVSEYLKGTGPNEITVEVADTSPQWLIERPKEYATQAKALASATALINGHNSKWDNRSAVLFLSGPYRSVATHTDGDSGASGASSATVVYTLTNNDGTAQDSFNYTVDTLSRAWLPASSASTTGARGASDTEFLTDVDGQPPAAIALTDLRSRISVIETDLNAGDGSQAYIGCVNSKYIRPWYYEGWIPAEPKQGTLSSGAAAGSEFGIRLYPGGDINYQQATWYFTGQQADKFEVADVDDDNVDGTGIHYSYRANRPLIAGSYELRLHGRVAQDIPCQHFKTWDPPGYFPWEVSVTARPGSLHEAFFDPVTVGTSVKADGSNGVLKPTSFTVGGTSTEITSLEWSNNQVVLTLGAHVSLSGQVLEFIELDGSVLLSLLADEATSNSTAGTYTWSMPTQPWENGDKLMLRIWDDT